MTVRIRVADDEPDVADLFRQRLIARPVDIDLLKRQLHQLSMARG